MDKTINNTVNSPLEYLSFLLDILRNCDKLGYPAILKTATNGYDGKGQIKFNSRREVLSMIYKELNHADPTDHDLEELSSYSEKVFEVAYG